MASKVFLLAVVLISVAFSECRPKASKSSPHFAQLNEHSGELNIGAYFPSNPAGVKDSLEENDSSSSEIQEGFSQVQNEQSSFGYTKQREPNVFNLQRKMPVKSNQQNSGEYNYQSQASPRQKKHYKMPQSSEEFSYQNRDQRNQQFFEEYQQQGKSQWNEGTHGQYNPAQVQQQKYDEKYQFPRQVQQNANSDESSSSSSSSSSSEEDNEGRHHNQKTAGKNQQFQEQYGANSPYYKQQYPNKNQQSSSQEQSNERTRQNEFGGQQHDSNESFQIKKASKIFMQHGSQEVNGRAVANQQRNRGFKASSEESHEMNFGGRVNSIYRI